MGTKNATFSNLTKYGFDMVTGVTHTSINQTLKRFLDVNVEERIICYKMNPEGENILMDYELFKKENGIKTDLFTLPENSKHEDLDKAAEGGFIFAMKVKYGWNKQFENVVNFVHKQQYEQQKVYYRMFYKECQMLFMKYSYRNYRFFHKVQNPSKPWTFTCKVNIDISSVLEDSSISQDIKDKINKMDKDMFSIEQLYLDLNSTVLHEGDPEIAKDIEGETLTLLKDNFVNIYLKELKDQHKNIYTDKGQNIINENQIVLGHIAKEKPGRNASSDTHLVIPKQFKLCLNKSDETGPEAEGLYTLNYLIMGKEGAFPAITKPLFDWNWVDKATAKECHGYIAIKRSNFVDYLKKMLEEAHQPLMFNINPGIKLDDPIHFRVWINPNKIDTKIIYNNEVEELIKKDGTILTYNHEQKQHDESFWGFNFDTNYTFNSKIQLIDNKIRVSIKANVYGKLQTLTSAWGNFAVVDSVTDYTMKADVNGNINVESKVIKLTITSNVDRSIWMKINCRNIDDIISIMTDHFADIFRNRFNNINSSLTTAINNVNPIVFMGDQTFNFKNPTFSDNKDLLIQITYKNLK